MYASTVIIQTVTVLKTYQYKVHGLGFFLFIRGNGSDAYESPLNKIVELIRRRGANGIVLIFSILILANLKSHVSLSRSKIKSGNVAYHSES